MSPEWIYLIFVFAFGSCIGSFLNVVIYRMPRDKSLVTPPSACPGCDKNIKFYDNIPILSWLVLRGKCRNCGIKISPRYIIIEMITGLMFVAIFWMYFIARTRNIQVDSATGLFAFVNGGWLLFVLHVLLFSAFLAASAIDMELWVIPLSLCWFVTAAGIVASAFGAFVIPQIDIWTYKLFPTASPGTAALAAGATIGLVISLVGLATGMINRSYEADFQENNELAKGAVDNPDVNDRLESLKEIVFLLPIIVCSVGAYWLFKEVGPINDWWGDVSQVRVVNGLTGSLWGYFIGCAVVWATRILGTLMFGKEAMGLGDVHLMGAAGAVIGPAFVTISFFIAPFFGLGWAAYQMFFKKTRQIPYGPFLSLAVFVVIIFHDKIMNYMTLSFR